MSKLAQMCWTMVNVVSERVIFCAIVSEVELSRVPKISELLLRFSAEEPVEFHVRGLGFEWDEYSQVFLKFYYAKLLLKSAIDTV